MTSVVQQSGATKMDMSGWANFFFAQVGASAGLAGLLFVGVSINLKQILASKHLPNRAMEALIFLLTVLVISSLLLVPEQSQAVIGIEVLVTTAAMLGIVLTLDRRTDQVADPSLKDVLKRNAIFNQGIALLYGIAGVVILVWGRSGLYWLVAAVIFSILKAMMDAWVLLVEINR